MTGGMISMKCLLDQRKVSLPARVDESPIKVLFGELLESPTRRPLLGREALVEIEPVFLLEVEADEGRLRDIHAVIDDVGQLAFRRAAKRAHRGIFAVR